MHPRLKFLSLLGIPLFLSAILPQPIAAAPTATDKQPERASKMQALDAQNSVFSFILAQETPPQNPVSDSVQWQEFSSTEGGFSISMPGQPTERELPVRGGNGPVSSREFALALEEGKIVYSVNYADLPTISTELNASQINLLLDGARDASVRNLKNGQLVSERGIELNGYIGREIEVANPDGFSAKTRIYWVQPRLYMIVVASTAETDLDREAERFLDSFRLLAEKGAKN